MGKAPGNDLSFGVLPGRGEPLILPRKSRDKHLYVCGTTGTGKTKLLEYLVRQDIVNWRRSKCGLLLIDPHGELFDNIVEWLAWNQIDRPIVPIDLRRDDWVVSYNLLRQRAEADPSVLIDNFTDALSYVWGMASPNQTPQVAQWLGNILTVLYEKNLTLVDAEYLLDRVEKRARFALTSDIKDKLARQDWRLADTLSAKDYDLQIGSTVRRLRRFIKSDRFRNMFGQRTVSLDLGHALEEGSIILVSLATQGAKVSRANAEMFATLLLSDLWTAAQERGKKHGVKPFYVYLDEFQRFVNPTISDNLDEARGFGLHLTMAHQFPNQLRDRGENGIRVYNSIMENASSKIVFRLSHEDNLKAMAQWLFMGTMDPDKVKHQLYSTKVMSYREELRTSYSNSRGTSAGGGSFHGSTAMAGTSGSISNYQPHDPNAWSESLAYSDGGSSTWTESEMHGQPRHCFLHRQRNDCFA